MAKKEKGKKSKERAVAPQKPEKLTKRDIAEKLHEGWIQAVVTFEIVGKPKAHVEQALVTYMSNLKKDERIKIFHEDIAEAMEQEEGFFSTFCEAEMLIKDLDTLTWLSINFSPASIEIMEPVELIFKGAQLTAWLNDLVSKLHEISLTVRNTEQKNKVLNASLNAIINNFILSLLEHDELDADELQQRMGIHREQLKPFLEHLEKKERIKKKGKKYSV